MRLKASGYTPELNDYLKNEREDKNMILRTFDDDNNYIELNVIEVEPSVVRYDRDEAIHIIEAVGGFWEVLRTPENDLIAVFWSEDDLEEGLIAWELH